MNKFKKFIVDFFTKNIVIKIIAVVLAAFVVIIINV